MSFENWAKQWNSLVRVPVSKFWKRSESPILIGQYYVNHYFGMKWVEFVKIRNNVDFLTAPAPISGFSKPGPEISPAPNLQKANIYHFILLVEYLIILLVEYLIILLVEYLIILLVEYRIILLVEGICTIE